MDLKLDILFLTETWQVSDVSPSFKAATPSTLHDYHITSLVTESGSPGSGYGVIISRHTPNVKFSCRKCSTFECMEIQLNCSNDKIVVYLVY